MFATPFIYYHFDVIFSHSYIYIYIYAINYYFDKRKSLLDIKQKNYSDQFKWQQINHYVNKKLLLEI